MADKPEEEGKAGEGEGAKGFASTKEKLMSEISKKIEESKSMQAESMDLHRQAEEAVDPKIKEDLDFKAKQLDKTATKLLKTAKRLEKGWLQGGAAGAGLGTGIAAGLGMTVGSLVTGLVAIPTTGLGIVIGAGTGLVHGPWVKFTEAFTKDDVDEIDKEAEEEAQRIAEG
ncbi:Uu.00g127340.m01.CDS01 [Anthostomella pinea]|uniref:Uu.00g127340.m01.CDS01 n=1 Tax=Anthostomella pinea TaxID=933095 RepID=A0AAI8YHS3_9PEZI|nr:Uu.00g127340.m01.CDS01 [Anthostomella pinea]